MITETTTKPKRIRVRHRAVYVDRQESTKQIEPLTDEQREMVNDSFLLARIGHIASKWAKGKWWIDRDELFSWLCEAMVLSVRNYDPSRGVKFRTYAMNRVEFAVKDYLRKNGEMGFSGASHEVRNGGMSFDVMSSAVVRHGGSRDVSIEGMIAAPNWADPDMKQSHEEALAMISYLPMRQRRLMVAYILEGKTMKQVAEEFGVIESRISQMYKEVIEELKEPVRRRLEATA